MEEIIHRMPSSKFSPTLSSVVCQESALQGLGHLRREHAARVESIIDNFLRENPGIDGSLVECALQARAGRVL